MDILQHDLFKGKPGTRGRKVTTEVAPKGKKQCTKCRKVWATSEFRKSNRSYDGLYPQCRSCVSAYDKKNQGKRKAYSWQLHYGISEAEYWELFNSQGGLCALCKQPETRVHKGAPAHLSVDHDHTDGRIRGLLCYTCNLALGLLGDSADAFQRAIDYLTHR